MMFRWIGLSVVLALMLAVGACKQGEGDRCQINDDCETGLVCNASEGVCQKPGGSADAGVADAEVAVDSSPAADALSDATVTDAAVTDAAVTDAGVTDAGVSDAP